MGKFVCLAAVLFLVVPVVVALMVAVVLFVLLVIVVILLLGVRGAPADQFLHQYASISESCPHQCPFSPHLTIKSSNHKTICIQCVYPLACFPA